MRLNSPSILACILVFGATLAGCVSGPEGTKPATLDTVAPSLTPAEFNRQASRFQSEVRLPDFENTPDRIRQTASETKATAEAALDALGRLESRQLSFGTTVGALDDISARIGGAMNRLYLIKETSPDAAVREAATEAVKTLQEWAVGLEYREDVYRAVKAYAETHPRLEGEEAKLLEETLRDYRRAGLALAKPERDEVERLRKELSRVATDFDSNVTKAAETLVFTKAELEGVPESFLNQSGIKGGEDEYRIAVNVTWQYGMILDNARREEVRRRVLTAQHRLAMRENPPLLERVLILRDTIAKKLGYATWADYQIEVKMARNAATAIDFEERLAKGLQPKFDAERAEFQRLKVAETGDDQARIHLWDWRYYANQLKKAKYSVDAEQLRVFFPLERVLDGMFTIYQQIFGLRFQSVAPPNPWVKDLQLWAVSDAATSEPLGFFYLDLFPREGKYNHFAVFPLTEGRRLPSGVYQRPVVAMVCNFPPPQPDKPSLLAHSDVETLFHEFGHVMHGILTRARFGRFSGANVPRDFVEAPSQMLEEWVWDKKVLDRFAADYRDPTRKIPAEILGQLKAAKVATEGSWYRRQLAFGLMDLALHTRVQAANAGETVAMANRILSEVFLPVPEGTALVAYFGHITGYDAGYYGYAWADAIAADMATLFEKSPRGYDDAQVGRRLRDEIYAVGDSRDVNVSIERFLGRPRSLSPFLNRLGIAGAP